MKKQKCATKFKLDKNFVDLHKPTLTEIMKRQMGVLEAIADRQGWIGTKFFWPGFLPGIATEGYRDNPEARQMGEEYKERWLLEFIRCVGAESHELMDMLNWKHWKAKREKVDWEEAKFEVVDIFIFSLCLAMASGMGPDEFWQRIEHKMKINVERQKNNY